MLEDIGIFASSLLKDLLIWDSTLGTTACNVLNLPTKYDVNLNLNPPWTNGWFYNNSGNAGEGRIELTTLNVKANSVVITSGFLNTGGTYIKVIYSDDTYTILRTNIFTTATEEYILDSSKTIKNFSTNTTGTLNTFMSYIKLKGAIM